MMLHIFIKIPPVLFLSLAAANACCFHPELFNKIVCKCMFYQVTVLRCSVLNNLTFFSSSSAVIRENA